jgi:hypothetical protein
MTSPTLHQRILSELMRRHYEHPLISNEYRGSYVECMVLLALGDEWQAPSDSWERFDCIHTKTGKRIEIKQSAATQSWSDDTKYKPQSNRSFEIKPRGSTDIYIYAWHGEEGDNADHRDPDQWQFFVVVEQDLPKQKSISLNPLRKIVDPCTITELKDRVMETLGA